MKSRQILKSIEKYTEERRKAEIEEGIVGYALFDTEKRAFVSFADSDYGQSNTYTGNVEVACVADTRGEAFNTMVTMLDDYFDVKIVPLISNDLFGLSPKPGSLESNYDEPDYTRDH